MDRPTRRTAKPRLGGQGFRGCPAPPPTPFHFPPQLPEIFSPSRYRLLAHFLPPFSPLPLPSPYFLPPHLSSASSTPLPLFSSSSSLLLPLPPVPSPLPLFSWLHLGFAHTIWGSMWFLESRSGIPKSKFELAAPLCVRGLQTAPLLCPRCCAFGECGTGSHTDFRGPRERQRRAGSERGRKAASTAESGVSVAVRGKGGCNDQVASVKVQMKPRREESGWYSTLKIDGFLVFRGFTFPGRELGAWA